MAVPDVNGADGGKIAIKIGLMQHEFRRLAMSSRRRYFQLWKGAPLPGASIGHSPQLQENPVQGSVAG